jgi:hypothetical protein
MEQDRHRSARPRHPHRRLVHPRRHLRDGPQRRSDRSTLTSLHVSNALGKLDVPDRSDAVARVRAAGLG